MAKNTKDEKTNVMRTLEQKSIPYTAHAYAHEEGVAVDGVTVAEMLGQMAPTPRLAKWMRTRESTMALPK